MLVQATLFVCRALLVTYIRSRKLAVGVSHPAPKTAFTSLSCLKNLSESPKQSTSYHSFCARTLRLLTHEYSIDLTNVNMTFHFDAADVPKRCSSHYKYDHYAASQPHRRHF